MVAIKSPDADEALTSNLNRFSAILLFGADRGLIGERIQKIRATLEAAGEVETVDVDLDDIAEHEHALLNEAKAMSLFGSHRLLLVAPTNRNIAPAVSAFLSEAPQACSLVVTAGALKKDSPLRQIFTQSKRALAVECAEDTNRDLEALIDFELTSCGHSIDPDARAELLSLLGANRALSRLELQKLAIYCEGLPRIGLEDVRSIVSDGSAIAIDSAVLATFDGDMAEANRLTSSALQICDASTFLGFLLRHAIILQRIRLEADAGHSADQLFDRHFRWYGQDRRESLRRQIKTWRPDALGRVIQAVSDAVYRARTQPRLAVVIAGRASMSVATMARRGLSAP